MVTAALGNTWAHRCVRPRPCKRQAGLLAADHDLHPPASTRASLSTTGPLARPGASKRRAWGTCTSAPCSGCKATTLVPAGSCPCSNPPWCPAAPWRSPSARLAFKPCVRRLSPACAHPNTQTHPRHHGQDPDTAIPTTAEAPAHGVRIHARNNGSAGTARLERVFIQNIQCWAGRDASASSPFRYASVQLMHVAKASTFPCSRRSAADAGSVRVQSQARAPAPRSGPTAASVAAQPHCVPESAWPGYRPLCPAGRQSPVTPHTLAAAHPNQPRPMHRRRTGFAMLRARSMRTKRSACRKALVAAVMSVGISSTCAPPAGSIIATRVASYTQCSRAAVTTTSARAQDKCAASRPRSHPIIPSSAFRTRASTPFSICRKSISC